MTSDLTAVLAKERPPEPTGEDPRGLLHDIGHGLATLSYLVAGLREHPDSTAELRGRLDLAGREIDRLVQLVDLRARPADPVVFDARPILEELVAVSAAAGPTRVSLHAPREVPLRADAASLWRMLSNLVGNAVRAAGPSGAVEVVAGAAGVATTAVEVVDDGPGFGAAPGGTGGEGLHVVRGLAERCGAGLRVLGGERTRVRLLFPAHD